MNDTIFITDAEAGERLDKILIARFQDKWSRTYFQRLIDEHLVLVNGEPVKKRVKPQAGDEVEIEFVITGETDLEPEDIPLDILYEDEHLLAVNKAAGMVVHPAPGNWTGTFVNALIHHCDIAVTDTPLRPGIVHRLDKDTTGVLIAAKTAEVQRKLVAAFAERKVHKEYMAVVFGNPGNAGTIDEPIGRHKKKRQMMCVDLLGGRAAKTHFTTLSTDGKLSVVKLIIETGRTHQIRVHMRHLNTPVLGDPVYGNLQINKKYRVERQMLHAYCLELKHPITGESLSLQAPLPEDMLAFTNLPK